MIRLRFEVPEETAPLVDSVLVFVVGVLFCSQEYVKFFNQRLGRGVTWGDRMEFVNGWYLLLIISDVFTIVGSFIKIGIESKVTWERPGARLSLIGPV